MFTENIIKSIDSTSSVSLPKNKCKDIYDLMDESSSDEEVDNIPKVKVVKGKSSKALKLFEGRNVIKKVKTHCLKAFYKAIKNCTDLKETLVSTYRLKIYEKRHIYKTFKSDISKFRNKVLLNLKMRKIMKIFSNINIHDNSKIKPKKMIVYNFLMNSKWFEILNYVKRGSREMPKPDRSNQEKATDLTFSEVNEYLEYIRTGSSSYKERINLDKNYLLLFDNIIEEYKYEREVEVNEKFNVNMFLNSFEGFN